MNEELEIVNSEDNDALAVIQRSEIDMQVATAKRFPRDLLKVQKKIESIALSTAAMAEDCFYCLTRKKKGGGVEYIRGPSVRLAELAFTSMTNMRASARVIARDGKTVTGQGTCWDLENNVLMQREVQKRTTYTDGNPYNEDMQVTAANSAAMTAWRNSVVAVVGKAYLDSVVEKCITLAQGNTKGIEENRTKWLAYWAKRGVNQLRVLAALGRSNIAEITPEDLAVLKGFSTAIKDGETTLEAAFPDPELVGKSDDKKPAEDDSNPELNAVKKPEEKPTPKESAQGQLAAVVTTPRVIDGETYDGFTFDDYREFWRKEGPPEINCDDWSSFDDVPAVWAARHVQAHKGMLQLLETMKGGKV